MTTTTKTTTTYSVDFRVAQLGNGTARHLADERGVLCNRWGSTNGSWKSPRYIEDAEAADATCQRCLRIAVSYIVIPGDEVEAEAVELTLIQRADRTTVARLYDQDTADYVAARYPAALRLLADGWTLDGALAHLDGTCDLAICTAHNDDVLTPDQEAEAIARATGSVGATVVHERRLEDGTLVREVVGSWTRDQDGTL